MGIEKSQAYLMCVVFNRCFTEILVKKSMKTLFSLMTPSLLCPPKTDHQHLLHPLLPVWNVREALLLRGPRVPVLQEQHFWWVPHSPPYGNITVSVFSVYCVCVCVCSTHREWVNWQMKKIRHWSKCQMVSKTSTATFFFFTLLPSILIT